ncbi:MAG: radical SAM protein [Candidatus Omnitrophica bacterium]|nr:radical SAM protein [Candidatus Omnitrophota bacterium]
MKFERIHVELTNRCNFSCQFCPDGVMTRKRGEMEFDLFKKIVGEIAEEQLTEMILLHVMGETLLCEYFAEAINYIHSKGLKVCLTTNGALMSTENTAKLIEQEVDHIIFSVQTPEKKSFELRKANMAFTEYESIISASIARILKNSRKTYLSLSFLTTPFKKILMPNCETKIIGNNSELREYFCQWVEAIVEKIEDDVMEREINKNRQVVEKQLQKANLLGWSQIKLTDKFILETRVMGDWVHAGLRKGQVSRAKIGYCQGLREHFSVLWNGDLTFCCVDYNGETTFGNIKDISLKEALKKREVQKVIKGFDRLMVVHPYCQKCLGDGSLLRSLVRQIGSILYFKVFRKFWKKKRVV